MSFPRNRTLPIITAWFLLGLIFLLSLSLGAVTVSPGRILSFLSEGNRAGTDWIIVMKLRLPRTVQAALTGICLALGGTVFQAVFRNPMAEPYILGISSGSALGASLTALTGLGISFLGVSALGVGAFAGAGASLLLLYLFFGGRSSTGRIGLLLGGVVLSFFLSSLMSLILSMDRELATSIMFWSMGSFTTASWEKILFLAPLTLGGSLFFLTRSHTLNLLTTGEETAQTLGIDVRKRGNRFLLAASLLTAAAVACSGTIGFIGLLVPHGVRIVTGAHHRRLLPLVLPSGASLMLLADLLARTVHPPTEIPVGVITGLLGAPLFLCLLRRNGAMTPMGERG